MALTEERREELRKKYGLNQANTESRIESLRRAAGTSEESDTEDGRGVIEGAKNVGRGFFKGVGSTLSGAASAGEKLLRGVTKTLLPKSAERALGIEDEEFETGAEQVIPQERFQPETLGEKIGFFGEQIAEFLIPGGAATKVGKATSRLGKTAGLLGRVGGEIIEGAGITALQTGGDITEMKKDAYISAALPIFGGALRATKRGITPTKGALATTGEVLTGVPGDRINKWYDLAKQAPKRIENAKQIITANPDNPFKELTQAIGGALNNTRQTAQAAFTEAVENSRAKYVDKTFDLGNKVPEMNKTFSKFNLKITPDNTVTPTTRTSPFGKKELAQINDIVKKMTTPNLTVDELLDFDASVKVLLDEFARKDNKKMVALGNELLANSSKFIDEALPEVNEANKLYRAYYEALDNGGRKIIDASGEVKPSAENFIKNITNKNKGVQQEGVKRMEKALNINILENVDDVKLAQQMLATVPMTTRNRTVDFLRAILASDIGKVVAGAGTVVNPAVAVPALLINVLSSPKAYSNIVEIIAGKGNKKSIGKAIEKLNQQELELINNILQGSLSVSTDSDDQ